MRRNATRSHATEKSGPAARAKCEARAISHRCGRLSIVTKAQYGEDAVPQKRCWTAVFAGLEIRYSQSMRTSLRLALYQPDIPQNAGTMLRACACLGVTAAIIEPAGFPISDRHFRRSGMDYLDAVTIERHMSWRAFQEWRSAARAASGGHRLILLSTQATTRYTDVEYRPDDILMVGRESAGVPDDVHTAANLRVVIPVAPGLRSLNVAVSAAMVLGEALRQTGFDPRQTGFA